MDDPAYSFIFPVPASRARYTPLLWSALIHTCRIHGRVYTTESVDGVACWASPGRADLTLGQALRTGFALPRALIRFPQQARKRMLQVLSVLGQERRRLNDKEHWYLEALGVDPPQQGRGVGRLLLAPVLSLADTQGLPCYLETETEANVAFYQKQGFRVLSTLDFPGTPVRMWTMARAPS
jgi:GNAT superfamily N-acetyltransferase